MKEIPIDISVYVVRNQEGKWFRSKGLNGAGDSWVDDFKKARIYTKIGPARSCVTWWTNRYPKYGIPDIIELRSTTGVVLDEKNRVNKALHKIQKDKDDYEKRRKERDVKYLQEKLENTQKELKKLIDEKT